MMLVHAPVSTSHWRCGDQSHSALVKENVKLTGHCPGLSCTETTQPSSDLSSSILTFNTNTILTVNIHNLLPLHRLAAPCHQFHHFHHGPQLQCKLLHPHFLHYSRWSELNCHPFCQFFH